MITDDRIGREMASRLGGQLCAYCEDPYEALRKVSRRPWSAILLTQPEDDLPGYCRALHRLRPGMPVYVWCSPEQDIQLEPLVGREVRETFLYPPVPEQVLQCLRVVVPPEQRRAADALTDGEMPGRSPALGRGDLSAAELMDLLRSARSMGDLEEQITELLLQRLNLQADWTDEAGGLLELLALEGPPRRVLVLTPGQNVSPETQTFLESVRQHLADIVALTKRNEALHHLAVTDELTGLFNRRYFYLQTDRILRRMRQENGQAMLVLFDLDNFKHYNDTHGHAVGDEILREVAAMMRKALRENDLVARIGGDEFAVLIWEAEPPRLSHSRTIQSALALVRRFADTIHRHSFSVLGEGSHGSLALSGGAAAFGPDGETCRELMRSADRALLRAKDSGKGVIQLLGDN